MVFPSFYEGFGLPILEAMACGRAVACSNTSSMPEVANAAAHPLRPRRYRQKLFARCATFCSIPNCAAGWNA